MLEKGWDLNSQLWQIRFRLSLPSVGEWIQMKVGQKLEGSRIVSTINSLSSEFSNIWNTPHGGSIKNLLIENKNEDGAPRNMIVTNKGKLKGGDSATFEGLKERNVFSMEVRSMI